ncbi:uncharacterized protein JN550_002167 [Neoarthrinium moseri]|uniref:uncharacterized protein n=1 Tax=Neoarthrinium moseri TaxID=1658444 RepID=UPI001FDC2F78|nr:uncharacterized protein JN550_002167 [Neoarthrinium moseri]KAI1875881.1 hypothetical protein JN550_002167 [Neoarthrinium moseri]
MSGAHAWLLDLTEPISSTGRLNGPADDDIDVENTRRTEAEQLRAKMPFLDIRGKSLYYTKSSPEKGSESGTTFLMIHGLGSSSSFYATTIPSLAAAGHTCVAFDTHGSALSKYNGQYGGIDGIVEDAVELITKLNLKPENVVAVGHSMGAIVASKLSLQLRLRGVVLIGPVNPNPGLAPIFNARIATVEKSGMEAMADTIPAAATGSKSTATHRAFIRALLLSQTSEGYNSLCKAISDAEPPQYSDSRSPLLILSGSDDKTSPLAAAEAILKSWNADVSTALEILDGVGHWHCIEAADEVANRIKAFAGKLE